MTKTMPLHRTKHTYNTSHAPVKAKEIHSGISCGIALLFRTDEVQERNSCLLLLSHHGWSKTVSRAFLLCWKAGLHDELNTTSQNL
ncbi:hypothetical protein J6590_065693 [Homalodisca vitripennis]|nr:hypothetical protein J6590_065693 [Homalodisca vitripennis]